MGRGFAATDGKPIPTQPSPGRGGLKTWLRNESMNDRDSDILIIGGGHNGLVCAAYLAAAGLQVRVLERRNVVGGEAVTEEFFPGFRTLVARYPVSPTNPPVIPDMRLAYPRLPRVDAPFP